MSPASTPYVLIARGILLALLLLREVCAALILSFLRLLWRFVKLVSDCYTVLVVVSPSSPELIFSRESPDTMVAAVCLTLYVAKLVLVSVIGWREPSLAPTVKYPEPFCRLE